MPRKGQKMSEEQKAKIKKAKEIKKEVKEEVEDVKTEKKKEEPKLIFPERVSWNDENFEVGDELKRNHPGYNDLKRYCEIKK